MQRVSRRALWMFVAAWFLGGAGGQLVGPAGTSVCGGGVSPPVFRGRDAHATGKMSHYRAGAREPRPDEPDEIVLQDATGVYSVLSTQYAERPMIWLRRDADFEAEMASPPLNPDLRLEIVDRNVILYGNADTNVAWERLLKDSPVQVRRARVEIGDRVELGEDLACLFVRPRPDSETGTVGVISGTGPAGMRLTDRLPYFVSGVGYPDCIVIGPEMLAKGAAGVRAAGNFGTNWIVASGDFAWSE